VAVRVALTIAGSDSGAGAGIQADLKTFAAHGVYGVCAITALTAQNTKAVTAVEAASMRVVRAQFEALVADFPIAAAKTGMLVNAEIVTGVAQAVREFAIPHLVVDPVMLAKSGDALLNAQAVEALRRHLLPLAKVVTPNLPEAEVLAGLRIRGEEDVVEAARRIAAFGPGAVLIKGGHAETALIKDLLFEGSVWTWFEHARVPGRNTHGTGCTFAAALAAHLALGDDLPAVVPRVQEYVAGAIAHAPDLGGGHGPMDHFWRTRQRSTGIAADTQ
jgi:hydroxymethylpyrimidine/phosphomethylpyrimidine kinase